MAEFWLTPDVPAALSTRLRLGKKKRGRRELLRPPQFKDPRYAYRRERYRQTSAQVHALYRHKMKGRGMQRLDVRLPPSTLAALRRIAALRNLSQAEVVQRLVLAEDQQVRERFAIAPKRLLRYEAGAAKRRGRTPRGKTVRKAAQGG